MILLDTNFILAPFNLGVDVFHELRTKFPGKKLATVPQVKKELARLPGGKAGLQLLDRESVGTVGAEGFADDALLEAAEREKGIVATNDAELKKRCLEEGVPVIFIRGKNRIELVV